ncbi:AAA family ATPase [Polaribacter sp. R2A056_3_33]|uniref:ATP-dependent DNA helicase n=1 Tax=Polaribacter sp. R2A056_3_33 TaxID=2745563 RepID=UPI001C4EE919|nr:AAA family ATPase [Polaribacter sp. R2A056_3_33]QXP70764.1 AAA family ATPase [Polaribacter sp. R2A056_3_33]
MKNSIITLTENQKEAVNTIRTYVNSKQDIFILTGAAGTGKTTVIKSIINEVAEDVDEVVLLAPTNRAAKVLSKKSGVETNTIHSEIYTIKEIKNKDGIVIQSMFVPKINSLLFDDNLDKKKAHKILFIVDESSMISDTAVEQGNLISKNSLLKDLNKHVKYLGVENKILFVGDSYQLPPIGYHGIAPALDIVYMKEHYSKGIEKFELTKILRQESDSYIIELAQDVKNKIDLKNKFLNINIPNKFQSYNQFIQDFSLKFNATKQEKAIALGWTRKSVLQMNLDVRKNIFGPQVKTIEVGDIIYLNAKYTNGSVVIPKGETGKIVSIIEEDGVRGGLLFHTVKVEFTAVNKLPLYVTTKILTDFLYTDTDYLSKEIFIKLAIEQSKVNDSYKKSKNADDDAYMSAMQAKFGYALTVHKSQGGEWENVYLHKTTNWKDLRWNYTAVTRASKELYSYSY